jgi:hypothetical protein
MSQVRGSITFRPLALHGFGAYPAALAVERGTGSWSADVSPGLPDDTSVPTAPKPTPGEYRVSELDQKKMAPTTLSKSRGRTSGLCGRSPVVGRPPLQRVKVIDMHQSTRTRRLTHNTPPWCQQRASDSWPFGGAFVLSAHTPIRPSVEGVGMT